jgi:hypothetical protein
MTMRPGVRVLMDVTPVPVLYVNAHLRNTVARDTRAPNGLFEWRTANGRLALESRLVRFWSRAVEKVFKTFRRV